MLFLGKPGLSLPSSSSFAKRFDSGAQSRIRCGTKLKTRMLTSGIQLLPGRIARRAVNEYAKTLCSLALVFSAGLRLRWRGKDMLIHAFQVDSVRCT